MKWIQWSEIRKTPGRRHSRASSQCLQFLCDEHVDLRENVDANNVETLYQTRLVGGL